MALFTINRYTGGDFKKATNLKRSSIDGLKELQDKAKLKKRKKLEGDDFVTICNVDTINKAADVSNDAALVRPVVLSNQKIKSKSKDCRSVKLKKHKDIVDSINDHVESKLSEVNVTEVENERDKYDADKVIVSESHKHTVTCVNISGMDEVNEPAPLHQRGLSKEVGGFTVLGELEPTSANKVIRKLPAWLSQPDLIQDINADTHSSESLHSWVDKVLIDNLSTLGVTKLFPVQRSVIPAVLKDVNQSIISCTFPPNDICVSAPTGSGKTLAFALPIVQSLLNRVVPATRALIVVPTRELAAQVHGVVMSLCRGTTLRCVLLGTAKPTFEQEQKQLVKFGKSGVVIPADIVISTPGILVGHITRTKYFSLHQLRFLVIDEADRMMDQIKNDWLNAVESSVSNSRPSLRNITCRSYKDACVPFQKLLFSATLSADPEKLDELNLFQPRLFTSLAKQNSGLESLAVESEVKQKFVGQYTTPESLKEYMVVCIAGEKPLIVLHLVRNLDRVLCFTGSIETAHRLAILIQLFAEKSDFPQSFSCSEFSSSLSMVKRNKILKRFKEGKINVLVCSDSMARGMDVPGVSHVILYDAPPRIKTYIHRIGRTARAGEPGAAYTLLRRPEVLHFKEMLKNAGKTVDKIKIASSQLKSMEAVYEEVLPKVAEKLKSQKRR